MKALVLEEKMRLSLRDFPINESVGAHDIKVAIKSCGICGSDIHYYTEGAIGSFVVREPMILGHEAAGIVIETGAAVKRLKVGDKVCLEPGVPDMQSEEALAGNYNLDPNITFWATPPVHGCLRETVVHPERFSFKLPDNMTTNEGAMIEPLATGVEAVKKARLTPGGTALVIGCGTIGIMCALAAVAGGASRVYITDIKTEKLAIAGKYQNIIPFNSKEVSIQDYIDKATQGKGVDAVFEASGSKQVYPSFFNCVKRGGKAVLVGMMNGSVDVNVADLQVRGISIETLFRYTNCFENAVALVSSGKINLKPLVSKVFSFNDSIAAYEFASSGFADIVKVMIEL